MWCFRNKNFIFIAPHQIDVEKIKGLRAGRLVMPKKSDKILVNYPNIVSIFGVGEERIELSFKDLQNYEFTEAGVAWNALSMGGFDFSGMEMPPNEKIKIVIFLQKPADSGGISVIKRVLRDILETKGRKLTAENSAGKLTITIDPA